MARYLKIDRRFYGEDGLVSLYRGDDWSFYGQVVDRIGTYETHVDLSGYSVTGYVPSVTGGVELPLTAATGACGTLSLTLPAAESPQAELMNGQAMYVVMQDSMGKLQTVPTIDESIAVLDRGFPA